MAPTILMVEDDDRTRLALAAMLEKAGYHVTPAADGTIALDLIGRQQFDVIITDIRMGDIDGIEVLNAARSVVPTPTVILLTGYGSLETAIAALRAGAYDYLLKPCMPTALLACVENAMQHHASELKQMSALNTIAQIVAEVQERDSRGHPELPQHHHTDESSQRSESSVVSTEESITVGRLQIDTSRHTVVFHNQTVHVTPIEYTILLCLAKAAERAVSYREIVQHTHAQALHDDEAHALLKSHMRNLRKKIDPRFIVSVRGFGYMFVDPDK